MPSHSCFSLRPLSSPFFLSSSFFLLFLPSAENAQSPLNSSLFLALSPLFLFPLPHITISLSPFLFLPSSPASTPSHTNTKHQQTNEEAQSLLPLLAQRRTPTASHKTTPEASLPSLLCSTPSTLPSSRELHGQTGPLHFEVANSLFLLHQEVRIPLSSSHENS